MITSAAMKNGFTGGLIIDFPNSKKAKKYFLFLMAGYSEEIIKDAEKAVFLPKAIEEGEDYNYSSSDEDGDSNDSMDDGAEEGEEETKGEEEDSDSSVDHKPADKTIKNTKTKRLSKVIMKARKRVGRFKANGNRKNKEWILKKKER